MRKRLAISALLLVGMTMSVAAFTDPPRASVERIDDGVTKVGKLSDLISDVTLITIKDLDRCVDVLVVTCDNANLAPVADLKIQSNTVLTAVTSYPDDHPVTVTKRYSLTSLTRKNPQRLLNEKAYLHNCCIKQCIQVAVAAAV